LAWALCWSALCDISPTRARGRPTTARSPRSVAFDPPTRSNCDLMGPTTSQLPRMTNSQPPTTSRDVDTPGPQTPSNPPMSDLLEDTTVLVPMNAADPVEPPPALVELLHPHRVVVLGYYPVPDQASPEQLQAEHGETAAETVENAAEHFATSEGPSSRSLSLPVTDRRLSTGSPTSTTVMRCCRAARWASNSTECSSH